MSTDIFNKVVSYLEFQKENFGEQLPVDIKESDSNTEVTFSPEQIVSLKPADDLSKITSTVKSEKQSPTEGISPDWRSSDKLSVLEGKIKNCMECSLGAGRKNFVFGSGNPNADILIIGEAPGADEDEQGLPFVGRAGQLLTKIIESVNLSREEVFIANIIKCRPPNNRRPLKDEIDSCEPYLKKQIDLIKPAFILSLGLTSVDSLLKKTHKMAEVRGKLMDYHGIQMIVTYHPAALLRNPQWKKFVWEDVKYLRRLYDDYLKSKKG
ncbi:MAG: uracil-DNA glycosylase [Candidatus Kapaibacterium sp.]|nr:uracil-DNA glycosylase [Candidatus Kapabacteria bacterium]